LQKRNSLTPLAFAEEEFGFDEGFAGLDAARRAEKVAADLDAEVAAQAAAELKNAQLPSIDEEVCPRLL
jgi:hypothetical protein